MTPEEKQIKLAEAAGWKWNAECDLAGTAFPQRCEALGLTLNLWK